MQRDILLLTEMIDAMSGIEIGSQPFVHDLAQGLEVDLLMRRRGVRPVVIGGAGDEDIVLAGALEAKNGSMTPDGRGLLGA